MLRATFKGCGITAHSSASNNAPGIQLVALLCLLFVVIPFILDVRLHLFGLYVDASAGVTLEEGHTRSLFVLSREGFSCPFPSSTMNLSFVYPGQNRFPLFGRDVRKNKPSCDCAKI